MFGRLTIAKKLLYSFCGLFVAFTFFGIHAYNSSDKLYISAQDTRSWSDCNRALAKLTSHTECYNHFADILVKTNQVAEISDLSQAMSSLEKDIDADFVEYRKVLDTTVYTDEEDDEKAEDIAKLNDEIKLWDNYRQAAKRIVQSKSSQPDAQVSAGEKESTYTKLNSALSTDVSECIAGEEEALKDANDMKDFVSKTTIGFVGAVLIFILAVLYFMLQSLKKSSSAVLAAAYKVAEGDLRTDIPVETDDEFGEIAVEFNQMTGNVRTMCSNIQMIANNVANASGEMSESADMASRSVDNISQAMNDLSSASSATINTVGEAVAKTDEGNKLAMATIEEIKGLTELVLASAEDVKQLGVRSKEITNIVKVISDIAAQTNLLAVNAAIEAARAGKYGKGFAVVSEEIRKLATDSDKAAKQIAELVQAVQQETDKTVENMNEGARAAEQGKENLERTGEALSLIEVMVQKVNESANVIQASVNHLERSVVEIVSITSESNGGNHNIAANSRALLESAQELQKAAMQFKL